MGSLLCVIICNCEQILKGLGRWMGPGGGGYLLGRGAERVGVATLD